MLVNFLMLQSRVIHITPDVRRLLCNTSCLMLMMIDLMMMMMMMMCVH